MLSVWLGFGLAGALVAWILSYSLGGLLLVNLHGIAIVVGGSLAAVFINSTPAQVVGALTRMLALFLPSAVPSAEAAVAEAARLARKAHAEGGLLAIQQDSPDFAAGFLHRAVVVAVSAGETAEIRRIMEAEIKQLRIERQEDANLFRTLGVLAPMFGLMGTLLGMIQVLQVLSEPAKLGAAMAMSLSSAFFGIMLANLVCIPVAGKIRLNAMRETLIYEILLEGVLDIVTGKPPYLVELHLSAYLGRRRAALAQEQEAVAAAARAGAAS